MKSQNPSSPQNGAWLKTVAGQFDIIINSTFPTQPASRTFITEKESTRLQSITRQLLTLSAVEGIHYIHLLPITTFPANGHTPLNTELLSTEYAVGWGSAYVAATKLARQSFPHRQEIIYGQLLYNTEGVIYSSQLPSVANLTQPINDGESTLILTHEADLIASIIYAVEHPVDKPQIHVMQQEKITQHESLKLFATKQNKTYLNIPIPISLAKPIFGPSASTWSTHYTPPKFTLQEYGQFLQFPNLKAGLHLA